MQEKAPVVLTRFLKFALVGAVATGLQYLVLIVLVSVAGVTPTIASTIGYALSAVLSYGLNYRFTFRGDRAHGPAMAKFATLVVVGLLINAALMKGLTGVGWYYVAAQIVATAVVLVWNFLGNSLWTFAGRSPVSAR